MDDRSAVVRDLVFNNLDAQRVGLVDQFAEFVERPEILLSLAAYDTASKPGAGTNAGATESLPYIRAASRRIP
jgi:sugar phosphate permease